MTVSAPPEGSWEQALQSLTPQAAPAPYGGNGYSQAAFQQLQSNLGSDARNGYQDFTQGLMAVNPKTGQQERVYVADNPGWDPYSSNAPQQTYFFESDPNRPPNSTPALAGGYSSGNDKNSLFEPLVLGGLGAIAGGAAYGALSGGGAAPAAAGGTTAGASTGGAAAAGGGEALGSGLTIGSTGAGGLSTTAAGAGGISSAGAAGTALAPGFFASEGAYPVLGGVAAAGGASALAGGAGSGSGGSAAGALGGLSASDWARLGGVGGLTLASLYGDQQRADQLGRLSDQYMALGAPSRERYEASFQPGFKVTDIPGFNDAMDTSYQGLLRGLSTQGNPFGNPGGLTEAQKYITGSLALPTLQNYRNQNAATGGFGAFSTAAPGAATGSIDANSNMYSDLGRGINNALNPPTTLDQFLRQMRGGTAAGLV